MFRLTRLGLDLELDIFENFSDGVVVLACWIIVSIQVLPLENLNMNVEIDLELDLELDNYLI